MVSPNLANLATRLGIDPSSLTGGGGGDSDDMPIFVARRDVHGEIRRAGGDPGKLARSIVGPPATRTESEYDQDFFKMTRQERVSFQERLFRGGFYDASVAREDIPWGVPDDDSQDALQRASRRAALYFNAGVELTLDQVIDEGIQAGGGRVGGRGGGERVVFRPTAAQDIESVAQKTAREMLGRALSDEERNRLIGAYRQLESQQHAAEAGEAGTVGALPSLGSFAEQQVEAQAPVEAESRRWLELYGALVEAIGGTSQIGAGVQGG
jgi:hypothetical protein